MIENHRIEQSDLSSYRSQCSNPSLSFTPQGLCKTKHFSCLEVRYKHVYCVLALGEVSEGTFWDYRRCSNMEMNVFFFFFVKCVLHT